ncbi:hypothetical protein [Prosthecobacter sp.]|uniref:hypothetical protein n=1 Tax=Prosthecobacter sp. TaxID=1965333 RepID=UPI0037845CB8
MTEETYSALASCARRRIEQEWSCTAAERAVLQLITDLSLALGQTWAFVPCLNDFAAVLGIHKSTVSRALRSALKKDFLLVLKRRDETLYCICTETRGDAAPEADAGKAEEARARLVALNQTRLQGRADPDGQQRLPGVLPSEETAAPARAFDAMMEESEQVLSPSKQPLHETIAVPRETISTPAMQANAGDDETWDECEARLKRMIDAAERARGEVPAPPPMSPPTPMRRASAAPSDVPSGDAANLEREMQKLCRGMNDQTRHVMERLREEFRSGGKLQEAQFFKWGRAWKKRALDYPRECLEACGEHKNLRLTTGPADEPGGWIYRAMQDLTSGVKTL